MEGSVVKRKKSVTFGRVRVRVFSDHNSEKKEEGGAGERSLTEKEKYKRRNENEDTKEKTKPGCGLNESEMGIKRNPSKTPEAESTKKPKAKRPTKAPRCQDERPNYDKMETKSILKKKNLNTDKMDKATTESRRKVEMKSRRNYPRESKESLTRTEKLKTMITGKERERERATTEIHNKLQDEVCNKDINNNTALFENKNAEKKTVLESKKPKDIESKKPKDIEKWPGVRNVGVMKELQGSTGVYSGVEADWAETKKSLLKIGVEVGEDRASLPSEFIAIMKKLIAPRRTEESKCEKSIITATSFPDVDIARMETREPKSASSEQTFQERTNSGIPGNEPCVSENISESCETHAGDNELYGEKRKNTTKSFSIVEKVNKYKVKKREGRRMRRCKSEGSLDISEKSQTIKESSRGRSCSVDDVRRVQGKHGDIKSVEGVESGKGGKRQKSLIKSLWDRIKKKRSKNERVDVGSEVVEKEHRVTELEKEDGQKSDEEENVTTLLRISRTNVLGTRGKRFTKSPEKNGMDSDGVNEAIDGLSQEIPEQLKKTKETNAVEKTKPVRIKRRRKRGVIANCDVEVIMVGKSYQILEVDQAEETNDAMKANQNADAGDVDEANHVEKDTEFPEGNHVETANQVPKPVRIERRRKRGVVANCNMEAIKVGKSYQIKEVGQAEETNDTNQNADTGHVERINQVPKAIHMGEANGVGEADHVEKSSEAAIENYVKKVDQILKAGDVERSNEILEADYVAETAGQVQEDDVLGIKKVETSDFCCQTENELDWLDDWIVIEMEQIDDDSKPHYVGNAKQTEDGGTKGTKRTKSSRNQGAMPTSSQANRDTNSIINAVSARYEVYMCGYVPLVLKCI